MTTLLVCSAGGHLKQLHSLLPRFELDDEVVWVTFETGLSKSLLHDQDVVYVDHVAPRDIKPVLKAARRVHALIGQRKVDRVISTGAGIAMAAVPELRLRRGECHYIESAARVDGPSLTGKLCRLMPGVKLYSQYPVWADDTWQFRGSVYDSFESIDAGEAIGVKKVVVVLGTVSKYGFRRMIERLSQVIPSDAEVLWQTSSTDVSGLGIAARDQVPAAELQQAISECDVVVSHAGNGTAITALEAGKVPVLVPRRKAHGEHIDDHQTQIADELVRRGLAVRAEADDIDMQHLAAAASRQVKAIKPEPFRLQTF